MLKNLQNVTIDVALWKFKPKIYVAHGTVMPHSILIFQGFYLLGQHLL